MKRSNTLSIYQHFRSEEKEFIDQILEWKDSVEQTYAEKLTDFLDPREQHIVQSIVGSQNEIQCAFFGGTDASERKRALIYPEFFPVQHSDFAIALYEVKYPHKFVTIEHKHVLGSLMSLGIKRGKFGDILINGKQVQFFVTNEMSEFVELELKTIGRDSISLKKLPVKQAIEAKETWRECQITATSPRIDVVISSLYRISRQKAQLYIQQKLVRVNWEVITQAAFECEEGDIISVRGAGRAKIISFLGKSRKEKWQILVGTQK